MCIFNLVIISVWYSILFVVKIKKDKDNVDRIDNAEKNENKILFDNDIQNKIIVFISCLIVMGKIK
jgi:uncharacterized ion transporter superfamily protein YfcC